MDAEKNDDETNESSSQSQPGSEQKPSSKPRDLRPEKDPMGGGKVVAQYSEDGVSLN